MDDSCKCVDIRVHKLWDRCRPSFHKTLRSNPLNRSMNRRSGRMSLHFYTGIHMHNCRRNDRTDIVPGICPPRIRGGNDMFRIRDRKGLRYSNRNAPDNLNHECPGGTDSHRLDPGNCILFYFKNLN